MKMTTQSVIIAIALLLLVIVIKYKLPNKKYIIADYSESDIKQYEIGRSILTKAELILYRVIRKHMNAQFIISPKVRLADFINIKSKTFGNQARSTRPAFNRISGKHADYLICNLNGTPLAWIELDDKSHNTKGAKKADKFKDDLANYIGIPLYRIKIGSDYNAAISGIKATHL